MTTSITFTLYLLFVGLVSWWAYNRTQQQADYFLGGRRLSAPTAALSAGASDMSGWLLLGLPGYAFVSGLESVWLSSGLCVGLAMCWFFVAKRLRIYTEMLDDALTIPAYLSRRFNETSPLIRIITAALTLFFFLFYVSSGFVAGAKLFAELFSVSHVSGAWLTFLFVVAYTFVGGFLAVSWTDVLQGLLMLLALLFVPVMIVVANGGFANSVDFIAAQNAELLNPFTGVDGQQLGVVTIVGLLGWGLGYFGQPHILARFKAIDSENSVPAAAKIALTWSVLVNVGAIAVGLFALLTFSNQGMTLGDSEQVFIVLTNTLFHPLIAGILLAAILAAIMSTADSQLLVCSSALAEDLLDMIKTKRQVRPLLWGRVGVFVIGILALLLAMNPDSQVLAIVSYAWAGLGAAFGPIILISLYSEKVSRLAAIAGILAGGMTVVVWKQLSGGIFDLYELVPGFIFSAICILVVTNLAPNHDTRVRENHRTFLRCLTRPS